MFSTDKGDGAIGAASVAAFGYFEIGVVGRSADLPPTGKSRFTFDEFVPFMYAIPSVHFGQFGR